MRFDIQKNHHKPLFQQFKEALRDKILSGELAAGQPLPPLKELADIAGVSIFTVDRGINGLIQEGLLTRRPKKGTYVNDLSEKSGAGPRTARRRKIILSIRGRDPSNYSPDTYFGLIFLGMQEAAAEASVSLVTATVDDLEENLGFYEAQDDFQLLGVVLVDEVDAGSYLKVVEKWPQTSFVLSNCRIPDFDLTPQNLTGVFNDDFGGGYDIATMVARAGHRNIAIFSRKLVEDNYRKRVDGMLQALAEYGVTVDADLIFEEMSAGTNEALGDHYMEHLLGRSGALPTAIMAVNDLMALSAMNFLKEKKPRADVQFTGFDAFLASLGGASKFPTVEVDFRQIGRRSIDAILRACASSVPKIINVPAQVIARTSQATSRAPILAAR